MALKVCRNRCLAHAASDTALEMATPVLKMFFALLEHGGSLHAENEDKSVHHTVLKTKLTASSQPKGQSSYAIASSCVFASPFDSANVCECYLEQSRLACNYDTGLDSYFAAVLTLIQPLGPLLPSSRRIFAQVYLSCHPSTTTSSLQRGTPPDSP